MISAAEKSSFRPPHPFKSKPNDFGTLQKLQVSQAANAWSPIEKYLPALREDDPFLARITSISREKHFHFSRELLLFLARIASVSRENYKLFSRGLQVVLARNASCSRRACKIGSSGIFLASEPSEPF